MQVQFFIFESFSSLPSVTDGCWCSINVIRLFLTHRRKLLRHILRDIRWRTPGFEVMSCPDHEMKCDSIIDQDTALGWPCSVATKVCCWMMEPGLRHTGHVVCSLKVPNLDSLYSALSVLRLFAVVCIMLHCPLKGATVLCTEVLWLFSL
jgi:hypothetical protein